MPNQRNTGKNSNDDPLFSSKNIQQNLVNKPRKPSAMRQRKG